MSGSVDRAQLLLSHGRPAEAEQMLREGLAQDPQDPAAQALLAMCLDQLDRMDEAQAAADTAVGLAPDWSFVHYVRGIVLVDRQKLAEADMALDEAIRLDPDSPEAFALKAAICLQRGEWPAALEAAEFALALDPENETALNARAQALIKQGRTADAMAAMRSGLALHPEAPATHANQGWILLESGDPQGAMEHFGEALRLDPTLEHAREGYLTALKARYAFYRLVLRFQFWIARMATGRQWMVLIGLWLVSRMLRALAVQYPFLAPLVVPLIIAYTLFAILSWTADPLLNLILRFSPRGKLMLARHERTGAELFGGLLAGGGVFGLVAFLGAPVLGVHLAASAAMAAIACLVLLVPVGATFERADATQRRNLGLATAALGTGAVLAVLSHAVGFGALTAPLILVTAIGVVAFQFSANFIALRRPR